MRIRSIGSGHSDLQMVISQLKDVRDGVEIAKCLFCVYTYFNFTLLNLFGLLILLLITLVIFSPSLFISVKGINKELLYILTSTYLWEAIYNTLIICFFSGIASIFIVYNLLVLTQKKTKISESLIYSLIIFLH